MTARFVPCTRGAMGAGRRCAATSRAGAFTLIELVVVLGLIALMGALITPRLAAWGRGAEARGVREKVVALVRGAGIESTTRGVPVAVRYDAATGTLSAGQQGSAVLPRGWEVAQGGETAQEKKPDAPTPGSARASGPVTLMTWSPGGLVSRTRWKVVKGSDAIEVDGDAIDGVRVRQ